MEVNDASRRILANLLEKRTGQQLTMSRSWRIETALGGLMRGRGLTGLDQVAAAIVTGREPGLADAVVEALLNNETFFFRDRPAFDQLLKDALPRLQRAREREKRLTVWCAGCSTGQEAYSLAMSIADDKARWQGWTIDLLATDISRSAIERARTGVYSQFEVQRGLSVLQMMRWFTDEEGQQWRLSDQIRNMVRFEVHNLSESPPKGRFDLILCRNVLLYFSPPMQSWIVHQLAEASTAGAYLMMGAGETVIGLGDEFVADPEMRGLYLRNLEVAAPLSSAGLRR